MNPTILLVEDDENDLLFVKMALDQAGVTLPISEVINGGDALDYLQNTGKFADVQKYPTPYLVLLDLKLPKVPGLEVLKWMRERREFDVTVVIVLTSSSAPEDIDAAYRWGASAYVVKPPDLGKLKVTMRAVKDFWLTQNQRASAFTGETGRPGGG